MKEYLLEEFAALPDPYRVSGVITRSEKIYPLGSDTKVLSTIFELISRPVVYRVADRLKLNVVEPIVQNHYPDFTLLKSDTDPAKIAVDVKTTYRDLPGGRFSYTLGGYTSFIRPGHERKNIVFPFSDYHEHWVIGFVYERAVTKKSAAEHVFSLSDLAQIPLPFKNVEIFVQEKWRIASDRAGSGNTTNIGSIDGVLEDFKRGSGPFRDEAEFLSYWRGYGRTSADRKNSYSNIDQFRKRQNRDLR